MRHYNADPAHQRKLQFYGFDSPTDMTTDSPRQTLHVALDYLSSVDSGSSQEYRNRIDPLLGQDSAWENPAAALDPTQAIGRSPEATALRIETEEFQNCVCVVPNWSQGAMSAAIEKPSIMLWWPGSSYTFMQC